VAHATSFERQLNSIAARGTNERGCDKAQTMLQQVAKDVMLRINDVALRANGIVAVRLYC